MRRKAQQRRHRKGANRGSRPSGTKAVWFAIGAVVVVGVAVALAVAPMLGAGAPSPSTAGREVTVSMAGFTPNKLQAKPGENLTVTFVNPDSSFHSDGGGWHQFRIEALGVDVKIPPASRKTTTLRDLLRGVLEVTG